MKNVSIVLVEPQTPGNIGAVARVMANFSFDNLIIINPLCDIFEKDAIDRAKHGKYVLDKSKQISFEELDKFDLVIGTTAKLGNRYNIKRLPISSKELIKKIPKKAKVALLFGNEGEGLTNEQIKKCDFIVNIPANKKYPVLNLSHSVTILLYELFDSKPDFESIDKNQKDLLNEVISGIIPLIGFKDPKKIEREKKVWNQIISKSSMTKREGFVILGFLKKVLNKVKK
jgi:tRNA/rRNA methyltransferase